MFDVITIGTATRDVFLQSPLFKVLKDPRHLERLGFKTGEAQCFAFGAKLEVNRPVFTAGGGAANAAVTFARQGFRTASLIKVGADGPGKMVLDIFRQEKVMPIALYDKKVGTAFSVILLSSNGERTVLNYRGASEDVRLSEVSFGKLKAKWAYINPGHIALPVISAIVRHLKKQGAKIAMNPSKYYLELGARRLKPILNALEVILLNREEASYLTGKRYNDERGIFKKFDRLVKGIAVMTEGPKGVLVSDGKYIYKAGIFKEKKVADRTGAGDAFGSGFVAALARSRGFGRPVIEKAIRLGTANATSVVEQIGAQPGILSRQDFRTSPRWRRLNIAVRPL